MNQNQTKLRKMLQSGQCSEVSYQQELIFTFLGVGGIGYQGDKPSNFWVTLGLNQIQAHLPF